MAVINDTIDQLSYEIGEASGYIDGSKLGYEYGYHDCVLDLKKRKNQIHRRKAERLAESLYFTKQKLWGVALLLPTFLVADWSGGDMTAGVLTIPMSLILIFSKRRWLL